MNKNKNTLIYFVTKMIAGIAAIVAVSIRSLYIDPLQFSYYYMIIQFLGIINVIFISWLSESCARYYDITKDKKIFYSTYLTSLLFSIIISLIAVFSIGYFLNDGVVYEYFWYVFGIVILSAFHDVLVQIFRMSNKVVSFSLIMIFTAIANILVFVLLPKSMGISSLFLTSIIVYFVVVSFSFCYLKIFQYYSIKSFSTSLLSKSLKYSLPLILVWVSIWIYSSANTFVINYFVGKNQLSFYNMAYSVTHQSLGIITSSFSFAIFPALVSLWNNKDYVGLTRNLGNSVSIILKYMLPACFGICAISPFLFETIINGTYNPNNEGIYLICLFSVGILFDCVYQTSVKIWNLEEKTKKIAIVGVVSSLVNLGLCVLVVGLTRNYLYAAVVNAGTILVRMIIVTFIIRKKWKFMLRKKEIFLSLFFSIVMGAVVFFFLKITITNIVFLIIGTILGAVIYLLSMSLSGQMKEELKLVKNFLKFKKTQ